MVDSVTQLQSELNRLSELFYATVGELQRDAPPVSIRGEALVSTASTSYNTEQRAKDFSSEIDVVLRNLDRLIASLPPDKGLEHLARVAELQREDRALDVELVEARKEAEAKLAQVQNLYAAIAQAKLKNRKPAGEGPS